MRADKKLMLIVGGLLGVSTLAFFFWPKSVGAELPPKKPAGGGTDAGEVYEFASGTYDLVLKVNESTTISLPANGSLYDAVSRQPVASVHVVGNAATILGRGVGRAQIDIVRRADNAVMSLAVDIIG
jgi:hypothetical protein